MVIQVNDPKFSDERRGDAGELIWVGNFCNRDAKRADISSAVREKNARLTRPAGQRVGVQSSSAEADSFNRRNYRREKSPSENGCEVRPVRLELLNSAC